MNNKFNKIIKWEVFHKDRLFHILKDARMYDFFKYNYAYKDKWYIEYVEEEDFYIYRFNDFGAIFDKECCEILNKLYGKRKIDLHYIGDYE